MRRSTPHDTPLVFADSSATGPTSRFPIFGSDDTFRALDHATLPDAMKSLGRFGEPEAGSYAILGKIGEGAMAEVYLARHVHLSDAHHDELVALKVFRTHSPWGEHALDRIRIEVRATRNIMNRHVVRVYGLTRFRDGRWAIPMEFVRGRTLSSMLRKGVQVDYFRFARWGAAIAEGLYAAHGTGVIHRDLKPENIMIREDDTPALLDFGIAKYFGPGVALTSVGQVVGTLLYMAPEQFHSAANPRSDQYALGLVLALLATGEIPRASDPSAERIYAERVEDPKPYRLLDNAEDAPPAFARIVDRLLTTAPEGRFDTCEDVACALQAFLEDPKANPDRIPSALIKTRSMKGTRNVPNGSVAPAVGPARSMKTICLLALPILLVTVIFFAFLRMRTEEPLARELAPIEAGQPAPKPGRQTGRSRLEPAHAD